MNLKIKGGQKMDEVVNISKNNIWPIMLEMDDLQKFKVFTAFNLSSSEVSPYGSI